MEGEIQINCGDTLEIDFYKELNCRSDTFFFGTYLWYPNQLGK